MNRRIAGWIFLVRGKGEGDVKKILKKKKKMMKREKITKREVTEQIEQQ